MTLQTQRADILEIALAAALHYRHDMIGVPKTFPPTRLQTPLPQQLQSGGSTKPPQILPRSFAIDAA
jgi:hypothetical protein